MCLRLWIENAYHCISGEVEENLTFASTFQTEERFCATVAATQWTWATARLQQGDAPESVKADVLESLPGGGYAPLAMLYVWLSQGTWALSSGDQPDKADQGNELRAWLFECDAVPMLLLREGQLVLLPVYEDEERGHLIRTCEFALRDGDYLAIVSNEFTGTHGGERRWRWQEIATAIRRWTDTGCDAIELLRALFTTRSRLLASQQNLRASTSLCAVAMHVRPVRRLILWSGPPRDPASDAWALAQLMNEPGVRVICGDTTAQIAARLLGAELRLGRRPSEGWEEVPPTSHLAGVDLVTEGRVTLSKTLDYLRQAAGAFSQGLTSQGTKRHLPRGEDGAAQLTRLLLKADAIRILVGQAFNPLQSTRATEVTPTRSVLFEALAQELRKMGKLVQIQYI